MSPRTRSVMSRDDAWRILGLEPGSSPEEIRAAYRTRARQTHPDAGGDREDWDRLQEAYALLASGDVVTFDPEPAEPSTPSERWWLWWRHLPRPPRVAVVGVGGGAVLAIVGVVWVAWCTSRGVPWELAAALLYYPALAWLWMLATELRRPAWRPLRWYRIPVPRDREGQERLIQFLREQEEAQRDRT